jgi:hypothetical protein
MEILLVLVVFFACTVEHLYLRYPGLSVHLCLRQGAGRTGWRRQDWLAQADTRVFTNFFPPETVEPQFLSTMRVI